MQKNQSTTLIILAAVAVAGYFAFKKGGILNKTPAPAPAQLPVSSFPPAQFVSPSGIAVELPTAQDVNIYAPALDPTGNSLQLF